MDHGQAQHPAGMEAEGGPVEGDQQQAGGEEGREEGHDAEVPDMGGVEPGDARRTLGQKKGQQNAKRSHRPVGGDEDGTDGKEDWMHQSQDTA